MLINKRGITLIALIITIIVLLILAGITIALVVGDNGILKQSTTAKAKTEIRQAVEQAQVGIAGKVTENLGGAPTDTQVKEVLNEYFYNVPEDLTDRTQELETKPNRYKVKLSEILDDRALATGDDTTGNSTSGNEITGDIGEYVTDGLVVWYDGIQNTRVGNNPNATVWEDLSGNNNDGIFSEAMVANQSDITETSKGYYDTTEQGYVFWHNDAYIESTNNLGISGDAVCTVEIVSKSYSNGINPNYSADIDGFTVWFGRDAFDSRAQIMFGFSRRYNNKYRMEFVNEGLGNVAGELDKRTSVSYRKDNSNRIAKISLNGEEILDYTGEYILHVQDSHAYVGRVYQFWDHYRGMYGAVQSVRIYNRILTDAEVEQNYLVDAARFNID